MSASFNASILLLQSQILRASLLAGNAERKSLHVNPLVAWIAEAGLLPPTAILGPEINRESLGAPVGPTNLAAFPALLVPNGVGLVIWDADTDPTMHPDATIYVAQAQQYFTPLENCSVAAKAIVSDHIDAMLARLAALFSGGENCPSQALGLWDCRFATEN